jgi:cyclic-di-GMP-binding protein
VADGGAVRQRITLQDGIPIEKAKEIVPLIKDSKIRVQASIQEKQVRVSGKSRDDLQAVIALVKGKSLGIALQFTNYRST